MIGHANSRAPNIISCAALVLLLLAWLPTFAQGQFASPQQSLTLGMRVRILAPDVFPGKVVGTVYRVSDDSVTLDVPGRSEPVSVLRERILRLDVSDGRRSRGFDAGIGAGIGVAAGAVGGALAGGGHNHIVSGGEVAGVCALFGAGLGAFIGVAIPSAERWNEMPSTRYRVNLSPLLDHGLDLAIAWKF